MEDHWFNIFSAWYLYCSNHTVSLTNLWPTDNHSENISFLKMIEFNQQNFSVMLYSIVGEQPETSSAFYSTAGGPPPRPPSWFTITSSLGVSFTWPHGVALKRLSGTCINEMIYAVCAIHSSGGMSLQYCEALERSFCFIFISKCLVLEKLQLC